MLMHILSRVNPMLFIVYVQMQYKIVIITVVGVMFIFYYLFFK